MSDENDRAHEIVDKMVISDSHTMTIHSSQPENELANVDKSDTSLKTSPTDTYKNQFVTKREDKF